MLAGNISVAKDINSKHRVEILERNDLGVERVFNDSDITRDYFDSFEKVHIKPGYFLSHVLSINILS